MKRFQEFQKRQVQSLLELREAQADTETERRLEHLRQVKGVYSGEGEPASWTTCRQPVSPIACLCPQAQQRLREVVLDAHTTQLKRLKETNDR